jgi:hypothetical protein
VLDRFGFRLLLSGAKEPAKLHAETAPRGRKPDAHTIGPQPYANPSDKEAEVQADQSLSFGGS